MLGILKGLFTSGIISSIERIASEAIETDMESAEAKALFIKALDPNGAMRRDLSRFACQAYGFYLLIAAFLILLHFFGAGDSTNAKEAIEAISALFLPITTAWGTIVTASFGVNGLNSYKGK